MPGTSASKSASPFFATPILSEGKIFVVTATAGVITFRSYSARAPPRQPPSPPHTVAPSRCTMNEKPSAGWSTPFVVAV